jgi:hypothetical protein
MGHMPASRSRFFRVTRFLGSLVLALMLLPTFGAVLTLGILVESTYGAKPAQQLVYQSWWFAVLLGLLAINIFCAAVKKWPWKKYQTGFLITHVGLLTLIAGGAINNLGGVHGVMALIDTEDTRFLPFGLPASNMIVDPDRDTIRVRRSSNRDEVLYRAFDPGIVSWTPETVTERPRQTLAAVLSGLAHPWPRSWAMDLGRGELLEVVNYFPHALRQPFGPAMAGDGPAFPALSVVLASPVTGVLPAQWIGLGGASMFHAGPGLAEILGRNPRAEQLAEFQSPPAGSQSGKNGTLILGLDGQVFRRDVASLLGKDAEPVGKTGWKMGITQYLPNFRDPASIVASDPGLVLEMTGPDGKIDIALVARQPGEMFPIGKTPIPWQKWPGLWTWYHPPDFRYGDSSLKALLQLMPGDDGTIHYRSFASAESGEFHFEKAGTTTTGAPGEPIWSGMSWKFQVVSYLPRAAAGPYFIPVPRFLGQESSDTVPAIKCRLVRGALAKEFWLGKSAGEFTPVNIGGDEFLVGFHAAQVELDFALRLVRAEQTTDTGSSSPASQTSFLLLTDPDRNIRGEQRQVTFNQPLAHRGYRFYQGAYKPLGTDSQGKLVSRSVLIADRDPGRPFKYGGSTMVALGIACMFYMKAYFFRPLAPRSS